MKVAMVVPGGVDRSGTHRVIPCLLWLLERIARQHEVHVFAMRGEGAASSYTLRGATVRPVGGTGRRSLPTLAAVVAEHRRGAFDLLHGFWLTGPGVVAAVAATLVRRPVLLHIPGGDLTALEDIGYGGRLTRGQRLRGTLALSAAAHRTAPSGPVCDQARGLGYLTERLPLGVCARAWPPRKPRERRPGEPFRLVHVGSLNRVKDQTTLLHAAGRLADSDLDFTLDLVGEDTLSGEMQRLAGQLGLGSRVRFHGFLPQADLHPIVSAAHVMLVSSRHEAGPVAAAEAAMVGVPTVGTAVGMLCDWAPEASTVVPVAEPAALATAVMALAADEDRRLRLAGAAQHRAMAEDADWSARRVTELYRSITA